MRLMRRFAVQVTQGPSLASPPGREGFAWLGFARLGFARVRAVVRLAIADLVTVLAAVLAVLAAVLAVSAGPALATAAGPVLGPPTGNLASVVPSTAVAGGRVTFTVFCGSSASAATLSGHALGLPRHIQMRASPPSGEFTVSVILPGHIRPATYQPGIECSDGTATSARLLIPAFGAGGTAQSGDGATSATTWLAAAGLVLIGVGVVTGTLALRRRRSGRSGLGRPDHSGSSETSGNSEDAEDSEDAEKSERFDYSSYTNFRF